MPIDAGEPHVIETQSGRIERPGGRSLVLGETNGESGYRAKDATYERLTGQSGHGRAPPQRLVERHAHLEVADGESHVMDAGEYGHIAVLL